MGSQRIIVPIAAVFLLAGAAPTSKPVVAPVIKPVIAPLDSGGGPLARATDNHDIKEADGLFGSKERFSPNASRFSKWTNMLSRFEASESRLRTAAENTVDKATNNLEAADLSGDGSSEPAADLANPVTAKRPTHVDADKCSRRNRLECNRADWDSFIAKHSDSEGLALLDAVNRYMNRAPYIVDPVNWNLPDYWATPNEFFLKDGDCEDYAISKYVTLKRLGWPPESMRVVVLRDENLRTAHAVLAVAQGGETYILDNQADAVLPHTKILHYRPVYSINESGWWLHQRARRF